MAVWSDKVFQFEQVLKSSDMNEMDANFDALAEGAAGAPAIQKAALNWAMTALIVMYGGTDEPTGWLQCNGQAVSRSTFSDLFNNIGTTYGIGDGSTTFNVPDLRDRSPLGEGTMGGNDADRVGNNTTALGDSGGSDTHTLTTSEMPSHNHGGSTGNTDPAGSVTTTSTSVGSGTATTLGDSDSAPDGSVGVDGENHSHSISSQGGGGAHNNMHPFLVVSFLIKT